MSDWKTSMLEAKANFKTGVLNAEYNSREGSDASYLIAGVDANLTLFEATNEFNGVELTINGPNAGVDLGLKTEGLSAMAEASAVKIEAINGPLYVSANLNANTGIRMGSEGFQVGFLGFGLTLGIGCRFTFDTPLGSIGGSTSSSTLRNEQRNPQMMSRER